MRKFDRDSMNPVTVTQVCEVTDQTSRAVLRALESGKLQAHKNLNGDWIIHERDAWAFDMEVNDKMKDYVEPAVPKDNRGPEDNRKPVDNRKPSEVTNDFFVHAYCSSVHLAEMALGRENVGKWMVFAPRGEELDSLWMKVKDAVFNGLCWESAKVSTEKVNSHRTDDKNGVICVYTYDGTDEADAMRVREVLRGLGVTRKIPYKLDRTTLEGRYSFNTTGRVSLYYC